MQKETLDEGLINKENLKERLLIETLKDEIVQLKNQLSAYEKKWEEHNETHEKQINQAIDAFNEQIKNSEET